MTDKSVSESVIFIANISVIRISVILHIGAPLIKITLNSWTYFSKQFYYKYQSDISYTYIKEYSNTKN